MCVKECQELRIQGDPKSAPERVWRGRGLKWDPFLQQHLIKISKQFTSWARNQARQVKMHGGNMNETLVEEVFLVQNFHRTDIPSNTRCRYHPTAVISIWRISTKVRFSKPRNTLMVLTEYMTRTLYKGQTWRRLSRNKHCVGPQQIFQRQSQYTTKNTQTICIRIFHMNHRYSTVILDCCRKRPK
ncbi:hypothetical protein EJ08DRAFT_219733 [Tothia fuscella]|uniref:Uncharacterized protein n=1 Tax=Tothia fuscella TaxID=1048955 RepID=A0A9P4TXV2_9PEZI|nr:hypothetical protein EJ08DRAFT_219733 [Tothia fuscella]